ncbi:MAG: type II toxin-antitoxin system RelE/ParE family toxin [Nitrospinae bacterium]|nr:type II toxin-antitoxin system RelE/ParE family toxin [Nitrospinota bacterium]MBI3814782.1 type II toxin-antitoxin system RelE/ParE family toxin [Nitrospinota bacterium]
MEDEVEKISKGEEIGEFKRGDLAGFQVHKFKFKGQEYLIAYQKQRDDIVFYIIGTHENFYRELKRYIK